MLPAHPRVGGENDNQQTTCYSRAGSSPRGRGKLSMADTPRFVFGLIPAWAGKTWRVRNCVPTFRAHPRVGGENFAP